ncbi:MAG: hypothetical protein RLZ25_2274 [Pseudomonadota bacterium]
MSQPSSPDHRTLLRLQMPVEQACLMHLAMAIESLGEEEGWDPALSFQVDLVLEELVQNVIAYGYPDGRSGEVVVSIDCFETQLRLRVEDNGDAFDPLGLPVPDVEASIADRKIGGLGIHFARTLTDEQTYCRIDGRNCVELIKRLPDAPL